MWPFREKRAQTEGDYTDQVIARAEADALGSVPSADNLGVAESSIGLWERALAGLTVEPMNNRLSALTPALLALAGRSLATTGNLVLAIVVDDGMVKLLPAAHFDAFGAADPASWLYHVTLTGPSDSRTYAMPADAVVHFRTGALPASPWRGVSPLRRGSATAALAAAVEKSLTAEARLPSGRIATHTGTPGQIQDYGREVLKGGLVFTGTTSGIAPGPGGQEPAARHKPQAYGPEPQAVMETLRTDAGRDILGAFGVSPVLFSERGDGTAQRESWRRFVFSTVAPLARMIEAELRAKLDTTALVSIEGLRAADEDGRSRAVMRRAQAFKVLREAGIEDAEARRMAGLT